ncbi:hypothetical protein POM88_009747 [Heracleum sosnowskyi]|uniref:SET domain-containing protein n=1 Tax=Heracleum sosnowskyi TaxID=360622 RepID=A0AAD8JAH6_9APIA|nr:hypothetical protein POM88_009747 [Heracleum sosnowskyi]
MCTNRPFQKEKRIKVVKTEVCGWGVEATDSINKGDFIIEYVGEVISDAECKERLSYLKYDQFGPDQVKCQCGASNYQGYLGVKRKKSKVEELRNWDTKGRRTPNIRHRR